MNDTIETRRHQAMRAVLCQQQPSTLIDAVETRQAKDLYRITCQSYRGGSSTSHLVEATSPVATGLIGTVVATDTKYATNLAVPSEEDLTRTIGHEWILAAARHWVRWSPATKEELQKSESATRPVSGAAARLRVDRLTRLQAVLGLPMLDLAKALRISRQALYKWLDASKDITLHQANRDRLAAVERLAKLWSERTHVPLNSVAHEPVAGGRTVLELLVDEPLDEAVVAAAFDELVARLEAKPRTLSQRMADAGFKRRPSARSLPSDE